MGSGGTIGSEIEAEVRSFKPINGVGGAGLMYQKIVDETKANALESITAKGDFEGVPPCNDLRSPP